MSEDIEVKEEQHVSRGVEIQAKIKRGTGTRDQDEIRVKSKGRNAQEAVGQFEKAIENMEFWSEGMRSIQPGENNE